VSTARKPSVGNQYRSGYLHSSAWRRRRERWLHTHDQTGRPRICECCHSTHYLELHHTTYEGISRDNTTGRWIAGEAHEHLVLLCARCHEALHTLFEMDSRYRYQHRDHATLHGIQELRHRLTNPTRKRTP